MMMEHCDARTILIVDDHRAFADALAISLRGLPDMAVVGTATTAESAVAEAARLRPDLIVLDIRLGADDGLSVARRIRTAMPAILIVAVSAWDDWAWVARAASAGVNGYAPKSGSLRELLLVLRSVRSESFLAAPSLRQHPSGTAADDAVVARLTARESEVLALLDNGVSPAQIARILNISVNTCRGHVKAIYAKLGVGSQLEALATARRYGLVSHGSGIPA